MNLLLFVHSLRCGGAERVAASLVSHWASKGWDVTLVTLAPEKDDFYTLHPAARRIALSNSGESGGIAIGAWRNIRRIRALRRILAERRPEVALSMMSTANVVLALAAIGLPRMVTVGAERSYPPQMPMGQLWELLRKFAYGKLAAVVALTRESATWLRIHTRAVRVAVIPNPAVWPLPQQPPVVPPGDFLAQGRRVLLAVGRLSEEKQFDTLIGAFAALAGANPAWDLVIVGEGPLRGALERRIRALNLHDRVLLPGKVGNVGDWYERGEVYALTSRFEGFPNTLVEALAHGVPSVSFDCDTGPRDLIRHDVDGLLVPPNDTAVLTSALGRLMQDEALRAKFAARAAQARDRFSLGRIAGMWEELFKELQA